MLLKHLKFSILLIVLLSLLLLLTGSISIAEKYGCETVPEVSISAPDEQMVEHVCTAAGRAIKFLGEYELYPKRTIYVEVIERSIDLNGYKAFGSYNRQSNRILMMSLPALLLSVESPEMYNMVFDEEHYLGAIAHEIAHAIFNHNSDEVEEKWNNAAQEYLAHATQLGVLEQARREEIITSENTGPWESGDEISVTYMGFNTTGFAVKSYLHLTQLEDPKEFVQILLHHKWLYISVP